ncbi:MAG TPA: aminotransferase class III-fold pyridoxal phosphate-dependent enzyme [Deferrisomatales bacterium]|nr:aminotransferase class III-fold pyridoxal phosphate-dependent enzyme [Deferrisomatales bacterium]
MSIFETYRNATPRSADLYRDASALFPGGVSHNLRRYFPHPVYPRAAAGARFTDVDGHTYLDLWMGHYALILGHAFPAVRAALAAALDGGWHWGMVAPAQVELARRICDAVPSIEELRICSTGTEATMYAVRLARGFTGRPVVLKAAGGWHGASSDLSFAVKSPFQGAEGPGLLTQREQGVDLISFNDPEATLRVVEAHRGKIAGIIVEPMIGAGGFLPADRSYLALLREVCDEQGAVLIFDEIITGFRFRYGTLADAYGVTPDLTTLGKVVGGGLPIGVYGGRREIMEVANPALAAPPDRPVLVGGGTFSCNPLSLAGAIATLDGLKERGVALYTDLERRGAALRQGVEERFTVAGVPAVCTGKGSLFMTHLLKGEDRGIASPADIAAKTRAEIKDRELRVALLNHGVFAVHGGGSLSSEHGDSELVALLDAYAAAAVDLKGELKF